MDNPFLLPSADLAGYLILNDRMRGVSSCGNYLAEFEADLIHVWMPSAHLAEQHGAFTPCEFLELFAAVQWQPYVFNREAA